MNAASAATLLMVLLIAGPVAETCDRDVNADLLTIEDRLTNGRLEAARAYVDDLLRCAEGRAEPRVHLALATIEERLGHLNAAHAALLEAGDQASADTASAVEEASARFVSRWVSVQIVPAEAAPDAELTYAGLVTAETTATCLAELAAAHAAVQQDGQARTLWLVPGIYRLGETELRLPPGSSVTLEVTWAKETP